MISRFNLSLCYLFYLFVLPLLYAQTPCFSQVEPRSAKTIIQRMADKYTNCSTYKDRGVVTTVLFRDGQKCTIRKPFTTAYMRPNNFRFEFKDGFWNMVCDWHDEFSAQVEGILGTKQFNHMFQFRDEKPKRYIVHSDPSGVRIIWDVDSQIEEPESLSMAIAGASGVSSGSAHNIPAMLIAGIGGFRLTDLVDLERLLDSEIDGTQCYVLSGKYYTGDSVKIWIDKQYYMVRRLFEKHYSIKYHSEETTDYYPEMNIDIPKSA